MSADTIPHSESRTEQRAGFLPLDRFIAFSDGVFAIAITLLVLELPVPPPSAPVLPALLQHWPEFLGYFISFVYIGSVWIAHSGISQLMRRGDAIAYGINLLMLLFVGILPFATSLMVTHLTESAVAFVVLFYGIIVLLNSLTLSFLIFYVAHEPSLLVDKLAEGTLKRINRERWIAIGVALLGVALALVAPYLAVALYLSGTILFLILQIVGLRRHRHNRTAG